MWLYTLNIINFKCPNAKHSETSQKKQYFSTLNNTIIYHNALKSKQEIIQSNKNKCGIYKWVNKVSGKSYIGSSVNLNIRLSHYLSHNFLLKKTLTSKSAIYNALLTYGYENFSSEILEYCDRSHVIRFFL